MRLRTFAALFAVLVLAMPAAAQEQSGSIFGVVKDGSGAVLPGATVEARSPSSIGVRSTTTDAQGAYRFPALPPARMKSALRSRASPRRRLARPAWSSASSSRSI